MASALDALTTQLRTGEISRRSFVQGATALGVSVGAAGVLAQSAGAEDATPDVEPVEATTSITRAEYLEMLQEYFEFEEAEVEGGQLIETVTSDLSTLNPQLFTDAASRAFTNLMFHYLTQSSQIDGQQVPNLANYWELAEDGMTYTFHLPEEAMWHDGTPLTADDVIFSFDAMSDEGSLSPRRAIVMAALDSYRMIDDHTVELVAVDQLASFLDDVTFNVGIVPRHIWEDVPLDEWGSDPAATGQDPDRVVGSGPMRFVEWVLNDHATVVKDPDYWRQDEVYNIDEYIRVVVEEQSSVINALRTGETDLAGVNAAEVDALRDTNPELQIVDYDSFSMTTYYTNLDESRTTLFLDERVRKALIYGLDRDLIAETVFFGYAVRADGTQPVLSRAYAPDRLTTIYEYDPDLARELLGEAGWEDRDDDGVLENEDGDRLSFELLYSETSVAFETLIPYMQEVWGELGVEMIPSSLPGPTVFEFGNEGNFDVFLAGFGWGSNPDQGRMFRTDAAGGAGFNRMRYSNEEYDQLDDAQRRELDDDARIELLIQQTDIVNEDLPAAALVFAKSIAGAAPRVRNYAPNAHGYPWNFIWLEDA